MIGFLGKSNSGKDTCSDYMVKKGYTKRSFAEPLKKGVQEWFQFSDKQLYDTIEKEIIDPNWNVSPRKVFQTIGTDIVREIFPRILLPDIGNDFWVKNAEIWYNKNYEKTKGLVVWSDVRFQNEVNFILKNGGKVYKISRENIKNKDKYLHSSESEIENIVNYTDVITNNGSLDDLFKKLSNI